MNIGGLLSSPNQTQIATSPGQRQAEFQQLAKDLKSGNLSGAQQDFATLTSLLSGANPSTGPTSTAPTQSTMAQDFQKLGQDLQSGNLSAAQQDFSQFEQNAQQVHGRHHHHLSTDATSSANSNSGGLLNLLTNTATAAVSAYGTGGLTGVSAAGSLLSALV
jgi:hypothetical protein